MQRRREYLRSLLTGEEVIVVDAKTHLWATTHKALISPSMFTPRGRHLNQFLIGSDPEFCLRDGGEHRIEARDGAGLYVGLAAGSDQNERLVELRPWPSRSVVEHVAGILSVLRWLYRTNRVAAATFWRAGAFFGGDGMGGHIHFGRKRPTRAEEVAGLDGLTRMMRAAGLFPENEWRNRQKGDRLGQKFGNEGDIRIQQHGYEYRSLPSWLQSPTLAFIVLACSKLVVLDPSVTAKWSIETFRADAFDKLRGLAKLYRSLDDDAYLLYHILTKDGDRAFEVNFTADFGPAWGISRSVPCLKEELGLILPNSIKPQTEEIEEVQAFLLSGATLTFKAFPPSFKTTVPSEYCWVPQYIAPQRHSGFGDLIHNLVISKEYPIDLHQHPEIFNITGRIPSYWRREDFVLLQKFFPKIQICPRNNEKSTALTVPKGMCQAQTIAGLRAILLNTGLFPIWTVETVLRNSLLDWVKAHPKQVEPTEWRAV